MADTDRVAQPAALLGKQVRVTLNERLVIKGKLLGFGTEGEFVIELDEGAVCHAWPMLEVEEVRSG